MIPLVTGQEVTFWIVAPLMVLGALGLLFFRKAVYAALSMAFVMVNLAVLYASLNAMFLTFVQIIVYTGAIMMLFLFVLMLVGVDTPDSVVETLKGQKVAAWLAGAGHAIGMLWLLVVLLALMLLALRNVYGVLVVLGLGAVVALLSWFATPVVAGWLATGIAWLLLFAAPRPVVELLSRHRPGSDAAQLAGLTRVPKVLWGLAWLALTVGALLLGATWLVSPGAGSPGTP